MDVKGNINLSSRSETITGKNIIGDINFETQYCTISLDKLTASKVYMLNRSGGILLNFMNNPNDVHVKNDYGSVTIDLLRDFEGDYELTAQHGQIETSIPLRIREQGSSETGFGKIGNKNNKLYVETHSDDIVIRMK